MIKLASPSIDDDDILAVNNVLKSGYLVQGKNVSQFEERVSEFVGSDFAVAVSNCTAALHITLKALNVSPGDKVIVPTYSWIATANVVELCGAVPVFIDVNLNTFNMDPGQLEDKLKDYSAQGMVEKVKAIIPVHAFGRIAEIHDIFSVARKNEIPVIEDAACALGAQSDGKHAGTWGVAGCFSFHPRKAVTTGEGGVIVTNNSELVRTMRTLRNHGQDPDSFSPDFILPGFNYRMTDFQAALGLTQMKKIDKLISCRTLLAGHYSKLLEKTPILTPLVENENQHVFQSYVILLPARCELKNTDIIRKLRIKGVEASIGTYHMPMTTYFRGRYSYMEGDFPVTDDLFNRALSLPLNYELTHDQQEEIVAKLLDLL